MAMRTGSHLLLSIIGGLVGLLAPSFAWAHAVPTSTVPAVNAVLQEAPREIAMRFSERVEPRASSLQVLDSHGVRRDGGMAAVATRDPWLYQMALPQLADGVYTVSWRVMSADDGHVTEGAYVFVVGGTARSGPAAVGQVVAVTGRFDALTRWLGMVAAIALIGMLTASTVFWRKRLPRVPSPPFMFPWLAVLLLASGLILFVRLQRLPVEAEGWARLAMLLATLIGQIAAAKLGVAILLVGALVCYWWGVGRRTWWWGLALTLMVFLLLSDAWVSHSAATPVWKGLALGVELVHLLGVALWVGGLGYFATLFWWTTLREPSEASELAWAIPAFSILAVGSVGLLAMSGLYLTLLHVGAPQQLLSTPYGRLLLAKLCVVGTMLALGGYHQFIVHPRMVASLDSAGRSPNSISPRFRQTLRFEAALGLLALLLAAFLGSTSPPSPVLSHVDEAFRQVHVVDDAQLVIEATPLRPGPNKIRLTVTDHHGQPLADATGALLQLQATEAEAAPIGVTLTRESPGVFRVNDLILGIEGRWKGQVTVQRQAAYDLHDHFELTLASHRDQHAPVASSTAISPVTALVYCTIAGGTIVLLLMSFRRLHAVLQRLTVSNQPQVSQPDRR
jgi:copper transport protein